MKDKTIEDLQHEKDVAEEALRLAIIPLQLVKSCDYMPCREKCIRDRNGFCSIDFEHYFKHQAEKQLKEKK